MIKAICFDLDGVYFEASGFQSFKNALIKLGAKPEDINYCLYDEPMNRFKRGEIDEDEYWNRTIDLLGIGISVAEIKDLLTKGYTVNPEVHELVLKSKNAGFKTCICSNNFTTRVRSLNEKFDFLKDFDASVFSYEVKALKPSPIIFKELLRRVGVRPEELVYSDDKPDKLAGAQELGIKTFVFADVDQFKKELEKLDVKL